MWKPTAFIGLIVLAFPFAAVAASASAFEALLGRWHSVHAYDFNVDAVEHESGETKSASMHVSVDVDKRFERLVITAGAHRGSIVTWTGGDAETVKLPGILSVVSLQEPLRDPKVVSLRGNDIRTADLGAILDCYSGHRDSMVEAPGPDVNGTPTTSVSIVDKNGIVCDGNDPDQGKVVTKDELLISNGTGWPRRRMRFEGTTLVEQWDIQDITVR
jgi:hypothetical protein